MENAADMAKLQLNKEKLRLIQLLAAVPDERLNWSPSETSRTPLELAAHSATSVGGILGLFQGNGIPGGGDTKEMDILFRKIEKEFTSRDQVIAMLEKNCAEYSAWLDTLTEEQLAAPFESPFGIFPLSGAIWFAPLHLSGHNSQLEYVQTIYGDRDWRM